MIDKNKCIAALILSSVAGCAQTNQVDPITTSSISSSGSTASVSQTAVSPTPLIATPGQQLGSKVTNLGEGKARIVVTTLNSVNIRDKHACELGRFAQSRNATNVLTPLQTQVKTDIEGAQTYRIVDQEFSYYTADVPAPNGASSTASLLKRCPA